MSAFPTQGSIDVTGKTTYEQSLSGFTTTINFEGEYSQMATKEFFYRSLGWITTLEETGEADVWHLTAVLSADARVSNDPSQIEPPVIWELNYETHNISLLDIDAVKGTTSLSAATKKLITDSLKRGGEDTLNYYLTLYQTTGKISVAELQTAYLYYQHMASGFKDFPVDLPVLQRSIKSPPSGYVIKWSIANQGKIISTNTLLSTEAVPATYANVIPNNTYINNNALLPKAYGWLKGPVKSVLTNNGFQVSQTWNYGLWSTYFFGDPL